MDRIRRLDKNLEFDLIKRLEKNLYEKVYEGGGGDMSLLMACHRIVCTVPKYKNAILACLDTFDKGHIASIIDNYDYGNIGSEESDPNIISF